MNKKYIYRWTAKAADWSTYKMCYELAKTERGALVAAHRWCDDNLLHGMGADHIDYTYKHAPLGSVIVIAVSLTVMICITLMTLITLVINN